MSDVRFSSPKVSLTKQKGCPHLSESALPSQRRLDQEVLLAGFALYAGNPGSVSQVVAFTHVGNTYRYVNVKGPERRRSFTEPTPDYDKMLLLNYSSQHTQYATEQQTTEQENKQVLLRFRHQKTQHGVVGAGAATVSHEACPYSNFSGVYLHIKVA